MPSQRPFFSNFLAAFRAHSAIQQSPPKASSSQPAHSTSSTSTATSASSTSTPRTISTSSKSHAHTGGATTAALNSLHSPRTHSTSPLSISPGSPAPTSYGQNLNQVSPSASPSDHPYPLQNPHTASSTTHHASTGRYMSSQMQRRGSDSSSEGFRDVLGAEKWYIGGRTAGGEERFFKLGVIRRQRSGDRLSFDRLSL